MGQFYFKTIAIYFRLYARVYFQFQFLIVEYPRQEVNKVNIFENTSSNVN